MEIAAILLTLGVIILVGLYLYAPLLERRAQSVTTEEHDRSALLAERERVVTSLQELDFDFQLGKVPEEDYPTQRTLLLQRGAEILKKLDELQPVKTTLEDDERMERAIASRRKLKSNGDHELSDDEIESMLSSRRKSHKEKSAGFCPNCGKPVLASDSFCPSCGKSLK